MLTIEMTLAPLDMVADGRPRQLTQEQQHPERSLAQGAGLEAAR